jgi:hypothetical protein
VTLPSDLIRDLAVGLAEEPALINSLSDEHLDARAIWPVARRLPKRVWEHLAVVGVSPVSRGVERR